MSAPRSSVTSVSGTPTRQYSANPMRTPELRAASTTMRLATEPRIVKFPDSVDAIATSSHARVGSASCGTIGLNTSTAGTRSEEHTSELQSQSNLVCRLLLEKKKKTQPERRLD